MDRRKPQTEFVGAKMNLDAAELKAIARLLCWEGARRKVICQCSRSTRSLSLKAVHYVQFDDLQVAVFPSSQHRMSNGISAKASKIANHAFNGMRYVFELFASGVYRMMLERTTVQPLREIIKVHPGNRDIQRTLLRQWAQIKAHECQYIQLAVRLPLAYNDRKTS